MKTNICQNCREAQTVTKDFNGAPKHRKGIHLGPKFKCIVKLIALN